MKFDSKIFETYWSITVAHEGPTILFSADDILTITRYTSLSGITYHTGKCVKISNREGNWLSLRQLNKLAKGATKTPRCKAVANWAKEQQGKILALEQAAAHIAKQKKPEASAWPFTPTKKDDEGFTVKEAAEKVGMSHSEFITWMISEGYFQTYESNGHLKMSHGFKERGYGFNPLAESGRVSNTVRLTDRGIEFVKNRLASEREGSVLNFAKSAATERKRLEEGVDQLIIDTFKDNSAGPTYTKLLKAEPWYHVYEGDLIKKVKSIIAQVKLKELIDGTK